MRELSYGNRYRLTIVCIDSYENGVLAGRIYNPFCEEGIAFHSTIGFLKKMDSMLEKMNFPQSFSVNRVFRPIQTEEAVTVPGAGPRNGKLATFSISILFRQNASWQGAVSWLDEGREESFRSVLELLLLLDSALEPQKVSACDESV